MSTPDTAFAHQLQAILVELGLDVDMNGVIIKTANTEGNVGVRADLALGRKLLKVLQPIRPRGVKPQLRDQFNGVDALSVVITERFDAHRSISTALDLARQYGQSEGSHHKSWVIDQMVRALAADGYQAFVAQACAGADGPNTYDWYEGIAP